MKKASNKWYFTKETNAKGLCYIYAYQTQWDPVTKKSKRSARKYVGRLAADSVVNITAKFRTEFPQYAQGTFYFGLDKTLVDEAAYRRDFPNAPGPKPAEAEIDTALWDTRSLGFTWALEQLAAQSQVLEHLREIFKALKSSKAPTNYFTPNILRKSWSRLVVSVVHLDALAFPVVAT